MSLIVCRECGGKVSTQAAACPSCGAKVPRPARAWPWVLALAIAAVVVLLMAGVGSSPQARAKGQERRAIEHCWEGQGRKSLTPAEQRFIAGACELMESDFRKKWGVSP